MVKLSVILTSRLTAKISLIDWLMVKNTLINLSVVRSPLSMLPAVRLSALLKKNTFLICLLENLLFDREYSR